MGRWQVIDTITTAEEEEDNADNTQLICTTKCY